MRASQNCIAALVALLSGCTAAPIQDENARIKSAIATANRETVACYTKLAANPKYSRLRNKVAINSTINPTEAQLHDTERPSTETIQLGLAWYSENQLCDSATVERWGRVDPELGALAAGWVTEITSIMQFVLQEQPEYSRINTRIKLLNERERTDIRRYYANLDSRIRMQEKEEREASARRSEETSQRISAAVGTISQVLLGTFTIAVEVLAARQIALAKTQEKYAREVRAYRPSQITTTNCFAYNNMLNCSQVTN